MIYMDNGAAEKPSEDAIMAAETVLRYKWANPNSVHSSGMSASGEIDTAKEIIAYLLNCFQDEVHFCSCACEAASWALKCMSSVCYHIFCESTEHSCVLDAVKRQRDYALPVVSNHSKNYAGFVSMLANNETGEVYKIPTQDACCCYCGTTSEEKHVLRFVDATAAVGHIPVDFRTLGCDYLCGDATKFGGIPGAAFMIVKRGSPIVPLIYGNEERGGTPPAALISAMAVALREKYSRMPEKIAKTVSMRDYMMRELLKIPDSFVNGAWSEGEIEDRLPGNVNISFAGIDATSLGLMLSQNGIMVSAGSACTSGNNEPSHVLLAMGVPADLAKGALRITINEQNTMEECQVAVAAISKCVAKLRMI